MKIPSIRKLELQAKNYSKLAKVSIPENKNCELAKLWLELRSLRKQWEPFNEKCNHSQTELKTKCICHTFPEYDSLYLNKLIPTVNAVNVLERLEFDERQRIEKSKLAELLRGRDAKISHCRTIKA